MAKSKNELFYVCSSCGERSSKWMGRCTTCGEWNTFQESHGTTKKEQRTSAQKAHSVPLSSVHETETQRISSGIPEFDTVCGGGIVRGAVILVGGEPGIGKSTLALQIGAYLKTLYVSGEESPAQIKQRAERLAINSDKISISTNRTVEEIEELILEQRPQCVVVDSIQTVSTASVISSPGTVTQVRESAAYLTDVAKKTGIPVILIGHITKEGNIAGPKILEHIVDTVLYFEGDWTREYRLLRSFKNRFGSVNEIGLFRMSATGLEQITDKNELFLNPYHSNAPGSAVSAGIEGSRTLLFEVQSLVAPTAFTNPRRMADGFDQNRLTIIAAVLEKYGKIQLSSADIFINLAGGFEIKETASDLAVAASVISSYRFLPLDPKTGFVGEISLSGDIRPVSHLQRRIAEFERNGFKKIIIPKKSPELTSSLELVYAKNIAQLLEIIGK